MPLTARTPVRPPKFHRNEITGALEKIVLIRREHGGGCDPHRVTITRVTGGYHVTSKYPPFNTCVRLERDAREFVIKTAEKVGGIL